MIIRSMPLFEMRRNDAEHLAVAVHYRRRLESMNPCPQQVFQRCTGEGRAFCDVLDDDAIALLKCGTATIPAIIDACADVEPFLLEPPLESNRQLARRSVEELDVSHIRRGKENRGIEDLIENCPWFALAKAQCSDLLQPRPGFQFRRHPLTCHGQIASRIR